MTMTKTWRAAAGEWFGVHVAMSSPARSIAAARPRPALKLANRTYPPRSEWSRADKRVDARPAVGGGRTGPGRGLRVANEGRPPRAGRTVRPGSLVHRA